MFASFNSFELQMTYAEAESCSHVGSCDVDVMILLDTPKMKRQLKKIAPEKIAKELREYGAWDDEELKSEADNHMRIVWIAACNITEEYYPNGRSKN